MVTLSYPNTRNLKITPLISQAMHKTLRTMNIEQEGQFQCKISRNKLTRILMARKLRVFEKTVGKEENVSNQHLLLFIQFILSNI